MKMKLRELLLLRFYQICLLVRVLFARFCSIFVSSRNFWLISERGKEARDNGYALYCWLKTNHPEIRLKYVISKDSKDFHRIESSDVVEYNSFNHLVDIWKAKYLISTHIMGYMPDHTFFTQLDKRFHLLRGKKKIFLQHGITKDKLETLFHGNIDVSLFVSGSQMEYDYINDCFGFPKGIVKYTGLCRYDNLINYESKKQLLIMPTFRIYVDKKYFEESEYFLTYKNLLESSQFHKLLEKYNYSAVFYPHYVFQSKIDSFKKLNISEKIVVADMNYDVQQLLKESNILITDYSSVFFDMMYMNKPVIFYQFDNKRYRAEHYKSGYLNYNDVGPVVVELSSLISIIERTLETSGDISNYQSFYDMTSTMSDKLNCKRVYDAIIEC